MPDPDDKKTIEFAKKVAEARKATKPTPEEEAEDARQAAEFMTEADGVDRSEHFAPMTPEQRQAAMEHAKMLTDLTDPEVVEARRRAAEQAYSVHDRDMTARRYHNELMSVNSRTPTERAIEKARDWLSKNLPATPSFARPLEEMMDKVGSGKANTAPKNTRKPR